MKNLNKTILFLLIINILISCTTAIDKTNSNLIITDVMKNKLTDNDVNTKYRYSFQNAEFLYYSDSLYNVGDTLKLVKK